MSYNSTQHKDMDFMAHVVGIYNTEQIHSSGGCVEALERNTILKISLWLTIFCGTLYAVTHQRASITVSTLLRNK